MKENNFEIKKRIVEEGNSKVFKEWASRAGITEEEFIEGIRWLCEDPCNGGAAGNRITRGLGCVAKERICDLPENDPLYERPNRVKIKTGLHRLRYTYNDYGFCDILDEETGDLWMHSPIKASINVRDKI